MELIGVCDVISDWRIKAAVNKGFAIYAATNEAKSYMEHAGIPLSGNREDLLNEADLVVDCTPKKTATKNAKIYKAMKVKFILQGGEKHETTDHSFNAESNYSSALNRESTRIVSCNATSIIRTLSALKKVKLLKNASGILLRRSTDRWDSHLGGVMNTLIPRKKIPSLQGHDAQTVDPELNVVTMAVRVPKNHSHMHYWNIRLTKKVEKKEIIETFQSSSRITFINYNDGLVSNNTIKKKYLDMGRPWGDMYEVAIWKDLLKVEGKGLYCAYMVNNQAIVIPETIDAIRALTGIEENAEKSIKKQTRAWESIMT